MDEGQGGTESAGAVDRLRFVKRLEPGALHAEDLDTARLVTRFQAGEPDAFTIIFTRYFDRVHSYLQVAFNDAHEVEDGVQQVFSQVFEALPRYELRPGVPFRAWLFVVVRRHAVARLRKQHRLEVVDPRELDDRREQAGVESQPEALALGWIADHELLLFVERLPLAQRQVLMLRYVLDFTTSEIAQVLGRSDGDVRMLESRALRFLRARLAAVGRCSGARSDRSLRRCVTPAVVARARRYALVR